MGEVIPFPNREPLTVRIRRMPIAEGGFRTKAEILHGTDTHKWATVEALVPRERAPDVIAAIYEVADRS